MNKDNISKQIEALLDILDRFDDTASATQLIDKRFFERSLNAELDEHLGHEKHQAKKSANTSNGSSSKTLYTDGGEIEIIHHVIVMAALSPETIKKRQKRVATLA